MVSLDQESDTGTCFAFSFLAQCGENLLFIMYNFKLLHETITFF